MANYFGPAPPSVPFSARPPASAPRRPPHVPSSDITRKNAIYYPNYRVYRSETPAALNYSCIDHVFYAFAQVNRDGEVVLSDQFADLKMPVDGVTGCIGSFMQLKEQYSYLKVILSIGGGAASQNFASVASNVATRDNFGRSAKGLVDASGFDGVDIDWEHPETPEQGRNFVALLATIRLHLPDQQYLLTAALPAGEWALKNIDLYKAQEYLDLINLMAYDFAGPWTAKTGHHAQLFPAQPGEASGSAAVQYVLSKGFPPAKILLGIPVYGRSFLGARGPSQSYTGHGGDDGSFEYKQLPRPGAEEITDKALAAAFCSGGDGGFVTYDNPETVTLKAQYCREKGLGGLFYWTGTADAGGTRSLVSAGFKALHGA